MAPAVLLEKCGWPIIPIGRKKQDMESLPHLVDMESLRVSRFLNLGCRKSKKEDVPEEWKKNYDSPGVDFNVPNTCNCLDVDGKKALAAYGDASEGCGTKRGHTTKHCGSFLEKPGGESGNDAFCVGTQGNTVNHLRMMSARSRGLPDPKDKEPQCFPPQAYLYDSKNTYYNPKWERYDEICSFGSFEGCPNDARQPTEKAVPGTTNFLNQNADEYWDKTSRFWAQSVNDREKETGTKQI